MAVHALRCTKREASSVRSALSRQLRRPRGCPARAESQQPHLTCGIQPAAGRRQPRGREAHPPGDADGRGRINRRTALPVEAVALLRSARTVAVRLAVAMTKATSWCDAGAEIAVQPLQIRDAIVDMGGAAVDLAPAGEDIIGHDVLVAGPTLSLWRALTDNDGSGQLDGRFIRSGLFRLDQVDRAVERVSPGVVRVTEWLATAFGSPVQHVRRIERLGTSDWRITERVVLADGIDDALRVGVVFELSKGFERVEWFGSGPWENYPDRARFAALGRWGSSVDDLQTDYVRPQENGGRGGVVELMLRDAESARLSSRDTRSQSSSLRPITARPILKRPRTRGSSLDGTPHSCMSTPAIVAWGRRSSDPTQIPISGAWRIARVDVATVDQGLVVGMPVRFSARPWRSPEMTSHVSATPAPTVRTRRAGPSDVRRADGNRIQDVDPFEHGLRDRVPPGVRGLRPQVRQLLGLGAGLCARQEAGEPVLTAVDRFAMPPAVPRLQRLDVLPRCRRATSPGR